MDAREFKYLNKSTTYTLPGVDNAAEYRVRPCHAKPADPGTPHQLFAPSTQKCVLSAVTAMGYDRS